MNIEDLRIYCMSKAGTTEEFPFDEQVLAFKVMGKIFALTGLDRIPPAVNLKCDPEQAIKYRESYDAVSPGYHMNKKHWNTVEIESGMDDQILKEMINHSYDLVVSKLTKKLKEELAQINQ